VNSTSQPREVQGVVCRTARDLPHELFARPQTIAVLLNDTGLVAAQLRRALPQPPRLVLWTQHAHDQPAVQWLRTTEGQELWDQVVCISDWQRQMYVQHLGLARPITVLRNAISPAFERSWASADELAAAKASPPLLAYTSTPFRGLDVLVECFPEIRRRCEGCRLAVYSSMQVYHQSEAGDPHAPLYAACRQTEGIDYRGSVSQRELAEGLAAASILAYPNTFAETSCIAAMEALAAGLLVVTADLGALPETCQGYARLIEPLGPGRTRQKFAADFVGTVVAAVREIAADSAAFAERQFRQSQHIRQTCTWDQRAAEWEAAARRWLA
jgi:glycosyltransferase involved in cell wall biosynthesis